MFHSFFPLAIVFQRCHNPYFYFVNVWALLMKHARFLILLTPCRSVKCPVPRFMPHACNVKGEDIPIPIGLKSLLQFSASTLCIAFFHFTNASYPVFSHYAISVKYKDTYPKVKVKILTLLDI